jgi:hypothetical protein
MDTIQSLVFENWTVQEWLIIGKIHSYPDPAHCSFQRAFNSLQFETRDLTSEFAEMDGRDHWEHPFSFLFFSHSMPDILKSVS